MAGWLFTCDPAYSVALFCLCPWCILALLNYPLVYFGVVKLFLYPSSVMLSLVILVCLVVSGGLALLVGSLAFSSVVKPCRAGFGVWWAIALLSVSRCTLALLNCLFCFSFLPPS